MTEYSDFLKHLGINKKQMLASMWSKIPESEKPSKKGREMTKEREGIFVIQYKDYNGYKPYVTSSGLPTLDMYNAEWFETRTKAYKAMLDLNLDKKCIVEEIKENE